MQQLFSLLFLLSVKMAFCKAAAAEDGAEQHWGYGPHKGPSTWPGVCQTGKQQSPIDIQTTAAVLNTEMAPIEFVHYNQTCAGLLNNIGHTVQITCTDTQPYIMGGGLDGKYMFAQAHFHMAQTDEGSDHMLDGKYFPAELHLVHIKEGLTRDTALDVPNSFAVIGVFYTVDKDGKALDILYPHLPNVIEIATNTTVPQLELASLLPPMRDSFYRYNGSLTTPMCNEVAIWTVMANPVPMLPEQLAALRLIDGVDGKPQPTNIRPVQPLNGRQVQVRTDKELYKSRSACDSSGLYALCKLLAHIGIF